jgi:hypothetical protein
MLSAAATAALASLGGPARAATVVDVDTTSMSYSANYAGAGGPGPERREEVDGPLPPPSSGAPSEPAPASGTAAALGPRIVFEPAEADFGVVPHGTLVRHVFRFGNAGDRPLEVYDVRASCGCTAAEPSRRTLLPGERAELTVTFDTAKKAAPPGEQRTVNTVDVRSNDRSSGEAGSGGVRLVLRGTVSAWFQVLPPGGLLFRDPGPEAGGAPLTATAEVLPLPRAAPSEDAPAPALLEGGVRVISLPPGVEVLALRPLERGGRRGVALDCAFAPGAGAADLNDAIRLATGSPLQPEVVIAARALVRPSVEARPPRLLVERTDLAAGRTIRLVSGRPVRALAALVDPAAGAPAPFAVTLGAAGAVTLLPVERAAGYAGGSADVVVFTDDPRRPVIRVPCTVRDADAAPALRRALDGAAARVSPPEVILEGGSPGVPPTASIIVTRSGAEAGAGGVEGLRVEPEGALEVSATELLPGKVSRITVRPGALSGPIAARVLFRAAPGGATLAVPVIGRALGRVLAAPEALIVSPSAESAEVLLCRADGAPLEGELEPEPEAAVEPEAEGEAGREGAGARPFLARLAAGGGGLRLEARRRKGAPPLDASAGPWTGFVTVRVTAPERERVRVPVLIHPPRRPAPAPSGAPGAPRSRDGA